MSDAEQRVKRLYEEQLSTERAFGPPLIGALLRMPVDVIHRGIIEALHQHGFTDIRAAHMAVLRYPGPQGQRPVDLAAQVGMTKQAMNYTLGQLESLGYLERRVDTGDVRLRRVHLTARGEVIVSVIRNRVTEIEAAWAAELGAEEFEQLRASLIRLNVIAKGSAEDDHQGADPRPA